MDDTATPEQKDRLTVMVKNFYKASGELLVEEHKVSAIALLFFLLSVVSRLTSVNSRFVSIQSLRAKERENNKVLQTRGELSETDKAIYDKMRKVSVL